MARRAPKVYTREQEIISARAKGELTHAQAARKIRQLQAQGVANEPAASGNKRGVLRRVLDFITP